MKEKSVFLLQRTLIITIYMILAAGITLISRRVLGNMLGGFIEVFLYSILHSYYCYEYKTTALEMNFQQSIEGFEI